MEISDINIVRLSAAVSKAEYGIWNRVAPAMVSGKLLKDTHASIGSLGEGMEFWMIQWKTCIESSADNMVYLTEKIKDIVSKIKSCQKRADGEYSEQDLKEIEYNSTYISNTFHWEEHQREKAVQEIKQLKSSIEKTVTDLKKHIKESSLFQEEPSEEPADFKKQMQSVREQFDGIIDDISIRCEELFSDGMDNPIGYVMGRLNSVIDRLEDLSGDLSIYYKKQTGKDIPVSYVRKDLSEWQELIRAESSDIRKPQAEFLVGGRKIQRNYGLTYEDGAYLMDKKI